MLADRVFRMLASRPSRRLFTPCFCARVSPLMGDGRTCPSRFMGEREREKRKES